MKTYAVRYIDGRSNIHTQTVDDKPAAETLAQAIQAKHPNWTVRVVRI